MTITINLLKNAYQKKGYTWYTDRPNLIGIKSSLQVPDVFNDIFVLTWVQSQMPTNLTALQMQQWLNSNLYVGIDGKQLSIDGKWGKNSQFALEQYQQTTGKERIKCWSITTDPGSYWLNHPLSKLGTAVLKPNQWVNCWSLGLHQNKSDHPALVQTSPITVYRDNDKDNISEEQGTQETGLFGINIHRSNASGKTMAVGKWSAGCIVFQQKSDHDQLLLICNQYKSRLGNRFTFTLLKEIDL